VFGGGHIWELAIVVILALIVFGPKRLPEIGGAMGKGIKEFKKGTQDLQDHAFGGGHSSSVESETTTPPRPVETPRVPPADDRPVSATPPADREAH
jgi:sec-independent protein translocase protein TatA